MGNNLVVLLLDAIKRMIIVTTLH